MVDEPTGCVTLVDLGGMGFPSSLKDVDYFQNALQKRSGCPGLEECGIDSFMQGYKQERNLAASSSLSGVLGNIVANFCTRGFRGDLRKLAQPATTDDWRVGDKAKVLRSNGTWTTCEVLSIDGDGTITVALKNRTSRK